jgi:hypothetical protein
MVVVASWLTRWMPLEAVGMAPTDAKRALAFKIPYTL